MPRIPATLCTAALLLSLAACASSPVPPPNDTIGDAARSIERAEQAQAHEFAAFELAKAERKLASAKDLANSDEDDDRIRARRLAQQAALDARLAEATARLASARTTLSETQKTVDTLRRESGLETREGMQ